MQLLTRLKNLWVLSGMEFQQVKSILEEKVSGHVSFNMPFPIEDTFKDAKDLTEYLNKTNV